MTAAAAAPTDNNGNGQKVTNAEIRKDIQHLTELFRDMAEETRDWRKDTDERLRVVEVGQAKLDTKVNQFTGFNAALAALAGFLGVIMGPTK